MQTPARPQGVPSAAHTTERPRPWTPPPATDPERPVAITAPTRLCPLKQIWKAAGVLAVIATACVAMAGLPDTAAAKPCDKAPCDGPRSLSLRAQADAIMRLSYKDFMRAKRSPARNPSFNWDHNGHCDSTPAIFAELFRQPCELHDFGYANYGPNPPGGLRLSRTDKNAEDTRDWIDGRWLAEMRRLCDDKYGAWYRAANKLLCRTEARTMWHVVRQGNCDWFPKRAPGIPWVLKCRPDRPPPAVGGPVVTPALPTPGVAAFNTWGSGVLVRAQPTRSAAVVRRLTGPTKIEIQCQKSAESVHAEGLVNSWWSLVPALGGWLSNIYVDHPAYELPKVQRCP